MKPAFFRFKKIKDKYLLTNEVGDFIFLEPADFDKFCQGNLGKESSIYKKLKQKNFIAEEINYNKYINQYREKHHYLFQGPSLHIVILTLRCNHRCLYCQASPKGLTQKEFDLNQTTAKKIIDFIFSTPSQYISIEFQGGEPFLNWPILEYITKYALARNKIEKRKLILTFVSNFTLLDNQKIKFLLDRRISACTSLDGPERLHNFNRRFLKGSSYRMVIQGIKKLQSAYKKRPSFQYNLINAVMTTTRQSLNYPKEIVDEYLKLGLKNIFIRPLSPFGLANQVWKKIGYQAEEYIRFYKKILDYIIKLNLKGKKISERTAVIFLKKILTKRDPNFLEIRSPCGAGIGQLAYNYNGDIYTCDEGRMLGEMGDFSFKLGNVQETKYFNLVNHSTIKTMVLSSCLDGLPLCSHCVWKPYCGLCPIYNYTQGGSIFSQIKNNDHCQINSQILEYLFEKLTDPQIALIFKQWIKEK
jgi:His-Xaa-Ser system radical SAM maturase HxsB